MSNNKLIIDLGSTAFTKKQRHALHNAIHKVVSKQLKDIARTEVTPTVIATDTTPAVADFATANLQVTFFNADPGLSSLTAVLNGQKKTITKSGSITFSDVESGDLILLQKKGNGSCLVTIDINATPMQVNFPPGNFNNQFFIS